MVNLKESCMGCWEEYVCFNIWMEFSIHLVGDHLIYDVIELDSFSVFLNGLPVGENGYWRHPLLLCWDSSVVLDPIVFLLSVWEPLSLIVHNQAYNVLLDFSLSDYEELYIPSPWEHHIFPAPRETLQLNLWLGVRWPTVLLFPVQPYIQIAFFRSCLLGIGFSSASERVFCCHAILANEWLNISF